MVLMKFLSGFSFNSRTAVHELEVVSNSLNNISPEKVLCYPRFMPGIERNS